MLKLKLQYFGHLIRSTDSLEKTLVLGKTESRWIRGRQRMRLSDGITDSMDMNLSKLREFGTGKPGVLQSMGSQSIRHDWATELNWLGISLPLKYLLFWSDIFYYFLTVFFFFSPCSIDRFPLFSLGCLFIRVWFWMRVIHHFILLYFISLVCLVLMFRNYNNK